MYTVIIKDTVIEPPRELLDSIDALFRELKNQPKDYEFKEGKNEN